MSLRQLEQHAKRVITLLRTLGADFCVIGGIAVSFRTIERTTKDLDLAVVVTNDAEAESIVNHLKTAGYAIAQLLEHDVSDRLSTVRLISPGSPEVFIDLLFASSGIEQEVVESSGEIEIFPNLIVRVATIPSLIALKVLSADRKFRLQDVIDLRNLTEEASEDEIDIAKRLLALITERGFDRKKDLLKELELFIER